METKAIIREHRKQIEMVNNQLIEIEKKLYETGNLYKKLDRELNELLTATTPEEQEAIRKLKEYLGNTYRGESVDNWSLSRIKQYTEMYLINNGIDLVCNVFTTAERSESCHLSLIFSTTVPGQYIVIEFSRKED